MMRTRPRRLWLWGICLLAAAIVLPLATDLFNIWLGYKAAARSDGTLSGTGVQAPVEIFRDDRYIVHIRAHNERDLYFAQGYAVAEDRLFQLELLNRYVRGRLAEWFGSGVIDVDISARTIDLERIVDGEYAALDARSKANLEAFADGVNAARTHEPEPVEFRILHMKPQPWTAKDSIAVGFATVLDLIDPWDDVASRASFLMNRDPRAATVLYQLTDPKYDAPIDGSPEPVPTLPPFNLVAARKPVAFLPVETEHGERGGSNNWAVGADHSTTGRAIVASDPHLNGSVPGVWHLVDLEAPGLHMAGASLPGTPGVVLGHNNFIAWGSTNGTTCSESLYDDPFEPHQTRTETFNVRFGAAVKHDYYRTAHGFVISHTGSRATAVDWSTDKGAASALVAFDGLNRAHSIAEATAALRTYTGPSQNFVVGDTHGNVAYQLAGPVPNDPKWCLAIHPASDPAYRILDLKELPHVDASRSAIVYTANAKMYGKGYPLRLTSNFTPPYRAARIAQVLHAKGRFSVDDFVTLQSDDDSIVETDIIHEVLAAASRAKSLPPDVQPLVAQLRTFDGHFDPASTAANAAFITRNAVWKAFDRHIAGDAWRTYYTTANYGDLALLMRALRENPPGWFPPNRDAFLIDALRSAAATWKPGETWGTANEMTPKHPLSLLGIHQLDGEPFPGRGNGYTVHVQSIPKHQQSYRAVWDVGNWDGGGMVIPSGESGEPGSGHYTDLTPAWNRNELVALPYTDKAVIASAKHHLTLLP